MYDLREIILKLNNSNFNLERYGFNRSFYSSMNCNQAFVLKQGYGTYG